MIAELGRRHWLFVSRRSAGSPGSIVLAGVIVAVSAQFGGHKSPAERIAMACSGAIIAVIFMASRTWRTW